MKIENAVVAVTGGLSGLGKACAEYLLSLGAKVAIFDLGADTSALSGEYRANGNVTFCDVDVTNEEMILQAIDQASKELGDIRACINCAGIAPGGKTVGRNGALPLEKFSNVLNVNLIGTFNVTRLIAQSMSELVVTDDDGHRGVIVNTASVAAFDGQIGQAAYAASKGGVASMTLPIARDLGPLGIRVNTIAPGVFGTPMMLGMPEEVRKPLEHSVQFPKRLGYPIEFAKMAAHIIDNDYLNGEVIRLDGGIRMAPK